MTKDGTTTTYAYTYGTDSDAGWSKLLKSYNGHTIDYDAIGNPISYMGATMEWSNGRQLTKYTKDGSTTRYTYDADGLRATKTVDGVKHTYLYVGGQLLYEKWSDKELYFWYDGNGHLMALRYYYNDDGDYSTLYAMTNAMGDVLGLYSVAGNPVVTYEYDAWGRLINLTDNTSLGTGTINPIRYRGYYYDTDSGLYYCQSRYYNPRVGRWVNADGAISGIGGDILGYNMFAYCFNNPVNMTDNSGHWPQWIKDAANWVDNNIIQPVVSFVKDVVEDIDNFDSNNESEEKVLESNYFSSYKGVPVIRTDGNRSGSFGAIFLTRETNNRKNPEDVLRHEYGHTKQLEQLGVVNYALCIGLPSWQQWGTGEYYSKPWEITADIYGGVQSRNHSQSNIDRGFAYLESSKTIGPFIWLFIE